mgnify:CR=1 FL=1
MPRTRSKRRLELPGEDLELVEDFGELIRKARIRLGLTQQDLAAQLNEKITVIKKIEAGQLRPSIQLAKKLEKFLKIRLLVPVEEESIELGKLSSRRELKGVSLGDLLKEGREESG